MTRSERIWAWLNARLVSGLAVVALLLYLLVYTERSFGPQIRSDGEGYYAYLPAYLIDGDPTMDTLASRHYGAQDLPGHTFWKRYPPTGRYVCVYQCGVALMMAPFFVAAHVVTSLLVGQMEWQKFVHPADGYSFFYQHAAGLAGWFYFVCGLWVLRRELNRHFPPGAVVAALLTLCFGTHLLHYMSGETVLSHPYSFFLITLVLPLSRAWHARPDSPWRALAVGLWLGLAVIVRETNVLAFAMFPLLGLDSVAAVRERIQLYLRHLRAFAWMAAGLLIGLLPQLCIWHAATGHWWFSPRTAIPGNFGGLVNWARPQVGEVLFSLRKGLLVYFPVLALLIPGLIALWRSRRGLAVPVAAYLLLQLYVVASYSQWDSGGGFGNRYFVETLSAAALALAALFAGLHRPLTRAAVVLLVLGAVGWTLFLMSLYYTREMSYYGMDRQSLFDFLWYRKQLLEAWLAR